MVLAGTWKKRELKNHDDRLRQFGGVPKTTVIVNLLPTRYTSIHRVGTSFTAIWITCWTGPG
jgi:hypothetical protein